LVAHLFGGEAQGGSVLNTFFLLLLVLFVACLGLMSCDLLGGATSALGPGFVGQLARGRPDFDGRAKVVSYNISFGQEIDLAARELAELEELREADIILLQEMDETGTAQIAHALGCNYVYYPASIHDRHGRYFGNAILSRWPMKDPRRILLPHKNPRNGQRRIATRAVVTIGDLEVLVYSVHTETVWLSASKRADQVESLVGSIDVDHPHVIVGGDFNTLTRGAVDSLVQRFETAGLVRASSSTGSTVRFGWLGLTLDHVFVRGMTTLAAGTAEEATASDHLPIWTTLRLDASLVFLTQRHGASL
jgi:endonuclease/exonuclease/phosphatase family metal-dependent hydrolase